MVSWAKLIDSVNEDLFLVINNLSNDPIEIKNSILVSDYQSHSIVLSGLIFWMLDV